MRQVLAVLIAAGTLAAQTIPMGVGFFRGVSGIQYTGKTCKTVVSGSTDPATCTWSSAPSTGENIYCWTSDESGTQSWTLTDSGGNTYTSNGAVVDLSSLGGPFGQLFYSANIGSSPSTTTSDSSGTPTRLLIQCWSVTGGNSSPVDGAIGVGRTASGTTTSTTVSPTMAGTILFAVIWAETSGTTVSGGTGFTLVTNGTGGINGETGTEYKNSSSSGSNTCDGNWSASGRGAVVCAAYK